MVSIEIIKSIDWNNGLLVGIMGCRSRKGFAIHYLD